MILTITLEQAKMIHRNMITASVPIDDQQNYYSFIESLKHKIFEEEHEKLKANSAKRAELD